MENLRYPAVPLITVDPYFSIWSSSDKLYDDITRHWTGRRHNMLGLLEIDGIVYRFMGKARADNRGVIEPDVIEQKSVKVYPMRTVYTFANTVAELEIEFMSPLLTDDLYLLSRPVSYISYKIRVTDGKEHNIKLYFGMDCEICTDKPSQIVKAQTYENGVLCGRTEQDILCSAGDDKNIEWGYLHMFSDDSFKSGVHSYKQLRISHYGRRTDPNFRWENEMPEINSGDEFSLDDKIVYIYLEKEFNVSDSNKGKICVAYDDIHSIEYFGEKIDAYYKKDGDTFSDICKKATAEYEDIKMRVLKREEELINKAKTVSDKYTDILSLVYRQVIAAHKLTWCDGELQFFSKECFSNGCIGTLDVTYPSIPMFLMLNPKLVEGMLNPIFKYVYSGKWNYDFAPHDVGRYPLANGQIYGVDENGKQKEEKQMPVEECGNAILCVYAVCHYENDMLYFIKHKNILTRWVKYLIKFGLDPENQLCTDDFAGHLAHNCNLSAKAIMGITAFGTMLLKIGDESGEEYIKTAKAYAENWEKNARTDDHYRLAFDKEDSWSIKYNLVWDKIFDWNIFSDEVFEKEIKFYLEKINKYGLPLDSRSDYTKSDWQMWSVRLSDNKEYSDRIIDSMWDMLNESTDRVPFTDWYFTATAKQLTFQNRTVQGGLYILLI